MNPILSIELIRYSTRDNKVPFKEWLDRMPFKTQQIIDSRITRLSRGLLGDSKSVGDGIYELRIDYGPGLRIYFAHVGKNVVLLTCGGSKASQNSDIEKSKSYLEDFKVRFK